MLLLFFIRCCSQKKASVVEMFSLIVWASLLAHAIAISPRRSSSNGHSPAIPFVEVGAYPGLPPLPGSELFRRQQSCSSFSLPCPSGICCSYSPTLTSCCGRSCCAEGYLCTGGTPSSPCCVAINSRTNTCGSDNVRVDSHASVL